VLPEEGAGAGGKTPKSTPNYLKPTKNHKDAKPSSKYQVIEEAKKKYTPPAMKLKSHQQQPFDFEKKKK
jgi:hypothetical protein